MSRARGLRLIVSVLPFVACTQGVATPPVGGPVIGALDTHCAAQKQVVHTSSCAGAFDGGVSGGYGTTLFGTTGSDDDCKYDVVWSSSPIRLAEDATFTVTVTARADGKRVTGAQTRIEAFLSDVHPAPSVFSTVTETDAGVYRIAPIRFDRSGRWTVRFHFFDACSEAATDSPHGHAAFYVDVP